MASKKPPKTVWLLCSRVSGVLAYGGKYQSKKAALDDAEASQVPVRYVLAEVKPKPAKRRRR